MDHGLRKFNPGGCNEGTKCKFVHPRMCTESLSKRSCAKLKAGGRCDQGFHVKGTKAVAKLASTKVDDKKQAPKREAPKKKVQQPAASERVEQPVSAATPGPGPQPLPQTQVPSSQDHALLSFLGGFLRGEMIKLLQQEQIIQTGRVSPLPTSLGCGPVQPHLAPSVQVPTTTMGSTLLTLLGVQ